MKAMLFAMFSAASVGPVVVADIDPDALFARHMTYALIGGTFGAGIFFCKENAVQNLHEMARVSIGNLLTAVSFGPAASYVICKMTGLSMGMPVIVPTSAIMGVGGVAIVTAIQPTVISAIDKWVKAKADKMSE